MASSRLKSITPSRTQGSGNKSMARTLNSTPIENGIPECIYVLSISNRVQLVRDAPNVIFASV